MTPLAGRRVARAAFEDVRGSLAHEPGTLRSAAFFAAND
jgi:hypothetical protein